MIKRPLTFTFKGARDYVQGPDIYNAVNDLVRAESDVALIERPEITLRRPVRHDLIAHIERASQPAGEHDAVGIYHCATSAGFIVVSLHEGPNVVTQHVPYPEEEIIEQCQFDRAAGAIRLEAETPFSDVEVFVSMNKALLQRLLPDLRGKWWLVKFQAAEYRRKSRYKNIEVSFRTCVGGKLAKSEVSIDGNPFGAVCFYLN